MIDTLGHQQSQSRFHLVNPGLGVLFFFSGATALIYQITWQRLLALFSGLGHYTITVIVAVFMAGLGIGSLAGGMWADRISKRGAIVCFGICELLIALYALCSPALLYHGVYLRLGHLAQYPGIIPVVHFTVLLTPTLLMGASLPLLSRGLVPNIQAASRTIGVLYGLNTLGAAAGCWAAVYFLLPRMGIANVILASAAINGLIGLVALALARGLGPEPSRPAAGPQADHTSPGGMDRIWIWIGLAFVSGFFALAYEILWFRSLWVALRVNPQTFGSVLGIMLFAMGAGTMTGIACVHRWQPPQRVFLWTQWLIGVAVALPILWLMYGDSRAGYLHELQAYWSESNFFGPAYAQLGFVKLHLLLPMLVLGWAAFLMGFSYPFIQKLVQSDPWQVGRRVGVISAAIILGNICGILITGSVLVKHIGTPGSFCLMIAAGSIFGIIAAWTSRRMSMVKVGLVTLISLGLAWSLPESQAFWARLQGKTREQVMTHEDLLGVVACRDSESAPGARTLLAQGRYMAELPFNDVHIALGAVPVLVHPNARDVLLIGFGSGGVCWGAGCVREVRRIECYEVLQEIEKLLRGIAPGTYPAVDQIFSDSRFQLKHRDGRLALRFSDQKYDVIELDTWDDNAYSGNLVSVEFFELVRANLKPGGLFCIGGRYVDSMLNSATQVFAHGWRIGDVRIFSMHRLEVTRDQLINRLLSPSVQSYFKKGEKTPIRLQLLFARGPMAQQSFSEPQRLESANNMNTDLFPRGEFQLRYP